MGLFGLFGKKNRTNSFGEDLDHLTKDGKLPYGWYTANKEFTEKLKSEYRFFLNAWIESRSKSDLEQYASLKSFVLYMNDVKTLCQNKGECFIYWLDTLFDDKYLLKQTELLKQLEEKLKNV